jgi:RNA polymerase sigma factor (sigma-70 family)
MPEPIETSGGVERFPSGPRPLRPETVEDDTIKLIEEIQAGIRVEGNFGKLFKRFRGRVHSYFRRKGFSHEESSDLTQDVFLRVFKGIASFRRESRFERWLWEIANHVYFNEIRRRKTDKRDGFEQSLDATVEGEEGPSPGQTVVAPEPNPEEEVVRGEQVERLRAALEGLPGQMRRCCLLRYEQGLQYQEIADVMKISIETVKAHLHQARKRLTTQLGGGARG